jgi:hypothetical protein
MKPWAALIVVSAMALAGCADTPPGQMSREARVVLNRIVETKIALPEGGSLIVSADKDALVTAAGRRLVDQGWKDYCALPGDRGCDPTAEYHVSIGVGPKSNCWATVYGVMVSRTTKAGVVPMGILAEFRCVDGLPAGELLAMSVSAYLPGETPPLVVMDGPGSAATGGGSIERVPVPVTTFTKSPS